MRHNKEFFISRIGKRVFRDNECSCNDCQMIAKEGIIIKDMRHADYLYTVQSDFMPDFDLNYRDEL